ncbi:MAG: IS200/IS605 family transposase [Sphingobacteriales bacterium]|nr:IS200/IS605 family transposase [Sphingobacteriales bacterium]
MPYIKAWFHLVWATKNRYPFLTGDVKSKVFDHIRQNAKLKGIYLDCVNGYDDHIHCLVSLSTDQTISKVVQLIKGESSFWINKEKLCNEKFEWQDEYFAVSVSHSQVKRVREYIFNQESHHQKQTFQQEYDEFLRNYQFEEIAKTR